MFGKMSGMHFFCGTYFKECIGNQIALDPIDFHCMKEKMKNVEYIHTHTHIYNIIDLTALTLLEET